MRFNVKNLSIRTLIIAIFMAFMLLTISGIGFMVFKSWLSSAKSSTETIADDINARLFNRIYDFLHIPEQLSKTGCEVFTGGALDIDDPEKRDKFFAGILGIYEKEIYSISYGTATGEYYGARRDENDVIQVVLADETTGWHSWYYGLTDDKTKGEFLFDAGAFDPRERAWYVAAEAAKEPVYSPIYKHFIKEDITVSYACPSYDEAGRLQGVLGVHILLTDMGSFLSDTVGMYDGYTIILEKDTEKLVANSLGVKNHTTLSDGALFRFDLSAITNSDLIGAYGNFSKAGESSFVYDGEKQNLYTNVRELGLPGLNWVVISAVPEEFLINPAMESIYTAIALAVVSLLVSFFIYFLVIRGMMKPLHSLYFVAGAFAAGDYRRRAEILRDDEIGEISKFFNQVADKLQSAVQNLEETVKNRTVALQSANATLEKSEKRMKLILDSTAEAIYGVDIRGDCTFCNESTLRILGYASDLDLLGKNMHRIIHHTRRDGSELPVSECAITRAVSEGKTYHSEDELFWRADGTPMEVGYFAIPQFENGKVTGAVVTFTDISDRKQKEAEIEYLNCHDTLTGLYNRRCLDNHRGEKDIPANLPFSVIFADINGLKMTNDIFGHRAGDELIKKSAEILTKSCRENDIVARMGGDEFLILLPKTGGEQAGRVVTRIQNGFADARVEAVKCSVSLGAATKNTAAESLDQIITDAENAMYHDKAINRKAVNEDIIDTLINTLHLRSADEKRHSAAVSELCGQMGYAMKLSEFQVNQLFMAGYLHDIGKIALDEALLTKKDLTAEEDEKMRRHPAMGYRILSLFDNTLDIAEFVYSHHERWDGKGYPRGLSGELIPLVSRILSVVETYERAANSGDIPEKLRAEKALQIITDGAGYQFDPVVAKCFADFIKKYPKTDLPLGL